MPSQDDHTAARDVQRTALYHYFVSYWYAYSVGTCGVPHGHFAATQVELAAPITCLENVQAMHMIIASYYPPGTDVTILFYQLLGIVT